MNKPPVRERQDDLPAPTDAEVKAQIDARRERKAEEGQRRRHKATYDLPEPMIAAIDRIADRESIPRSDVVAWAVAELLERFDAGQVDWTPHKRPAKSLRWAYKLQLPGQWGNGA